MDYLIDAHDHLAVRAANFLETIGGKRHLANLDLGEDRSTMVALAAAGGCFLHGHFLRRIREDNQEMFNITIPTWAKTAKRVIALNLGRAHEPGFEEALRQLHSNLTGIPLPKKRRSKRRCRNRSADWQRGGYPL